MKKISRRFFKSAFLVMMCIILAFGAVGCSTKDSTKDSEEQQKEVNNSSGEVSFVEEDGKVYVSLKDAFESVGGEYSEEKDEIKIIKDEDELLVNIKNKKAILNGEEIELNDNLKIEKKVAYLSIELLNEVLDARTIFNEEENKIEIREEMPLEYTEAFSVKYLKGGLKKVEDGDGRTLILVPKGKEVPEEYKDETIVNIPLKNVLTASTTQACLLRPLDELKSITAVTTEAEQWTIEEVKSGIESGEVTFVGDSYAPDYEKIFSLKPEIAFVCGGPYGQQDMMGKFDELGVIYAVNNEYLEEDPFGRMEWIKFMAAFYEKEDIAEKHFNAALKKVDDAINTVASEEKPTVAWGMVYDGKVYVPESDSYVAKMIEMAGGNYILKDSALESGEISIEEFYDKAKDADVFIWETMGPAPASLEAMIEETPLLADFKSVQGKNVWRLDDDYWQSIDKTDVIIKSLAAIFHPDELEQSEIEHYVRYTE